MPVIENENATMFIVLQGLHHSRKIEFELSRHIIYYKSQCQQKAQGLQAVGPHNRANAASARLCRGSKLQISTIPTTCLSLFTTCGYQECALLKDWMHTGKGYRDVIMLQKINF